MEVKLLNCLLVTVNINNGLVSQTEIGEDMERLKVLEDGKLSRDEKLQECDEILQELKEKVRRFIRTGEKNRQIDDAEKYAGFYRGKLREALRAENVFSNIVYSVQRENERSTWVIEVTPESAKDDMIRRLQEHFDAISIMSQFCLLASLSRAESDERKLHEAYDGMSAKYDILAQMVQLLYESPYSTLRKLSESLNVEISIVENTIKGCKSLFNVREFNEKYISLSPQGYDYAKYLPEREKKYSKTEMDMAIFENCVKMLSALQKNEAYHPEIGDADVSRSLFYHYSRVKASLNSRSYFYEDAHERGAVIIRQMGMDREDEDDGRDRYSEKRTS